VACGWAYTIAASAKETNKENSFFMPVLVLYEDESTAG